jgi:hypothetical protein
MVILEETFNFGLYKALLCLGGWAPFHAWKPTRPLPSLWLFADHTLLTKWVLDLPEGWESEAETQ